MAAVGALCAAGQLSEAISDTLPVSPGFIRFNSKADEKEAEKEITVDKSNNNALYCEAYVNTQNGDLDILPNAMNFEQASAWARTTALSGIYSKRYTWGLYTPNIHDAYLMAAYLGGGLPLIEPPKSGTYMHYHVKSHKFMGYKHFYIWFGELLK